MVQNTIDSRLTGTESGLASTDKPLPVVVKKTVLRDLQNENQLVVTNVGDSLHPKEKGPTNDTVKVSGTKRPPPEGSISPPRHQSPTGNANNGHLVYVRRKSETEAGKNPSDNPSNNTDRMQSRQFRLVEEPMQLKSVQPHPQLKEPKITGFPASPPTSTASLMSVSGKPSYSVPLVYSSNRSSVECNYRPPSASASLPLDVTKELKKKHWQERYLQLQMLLKHLDQSDQEEYLQMLRSFSSVELSRLAVDLEKRSIQLSLEEEK